MLTSIKYSLSGFGSLDIISIPVMNQYFKDWSIQKLTEAVFVFLVSISVHGFRKSSL